MGKSDHQATSLERAQVDELLAALPSRDQHPKGWPVREYYQVMWTYGARAGLLQRLHWDDVDFKAGVLLVRSAADKKKYGRELPLQDPATGALKALAPGVGLVFGRKRWMTHGTELTLGCTTADLPRITGHEIRHSRSTHLCSNSKDLPR